MDFVDLSLRVIARLGGAAGLNALQRAALAVVSPLVAAGHVADPLQYLHTINPDPQPSPKALRSFPEPTVDLTIVIPVYNVEKYLRQCLDSVINQQTRYSYHVIAVDDESTDGSARILKEYENHPLFTIIYNVHGGLSKTRNTAIDRLASRYVTFLDSDDLLTPHAVEAMLDMAFLTDAEVVQGSLQRFDETGVLYELKSTHNPNASIDDLLGIACGRLYKSSLFANLSFPEGYWFEDQITETLIYPQLSHIATIAEVTYLYRKTPGAITSKSNAHPKNLDSLYCALTMHREIMERGTWDFADGWLKELYLHFIRITFVRTRGLGDKARKAIFDTWRQFCLQHLSDYTPATPVGAQLLDAILRNRYAHYHTICLKPK